MDWTYERVNKEDGSLETCPTHDLTGAITGDPSVAVFNVRAWLDEHPTACIAGGWIKHIKHEHTEVDYDPQTQYLTKSVRRIDDHTIEDEFTVSDKSEEMLLFDEFYTLHNSPYKDFSQIGGLTFVTE